MQIDRQAPRQIEMRDGRVRTTRTVDHMRPIDDSKDLALICSNHGDGTGGCHGIAVIASQETPAGRHGFRLAKRTTNRRRIAQAVVEVAIGFAAVASMLVVGNSVATQATKAPSFGRRSDHNLRIAPWRQSAGSQRHALKRVGTSPTSRRRRWPHCCGARRMCNL